MGRQRTASTGNDRTRVQPGQGRAWGAGTGPEATIGAIPGTNVSKTGRKTGVLILVDLVGMAGGGEQVALTLATHLDPDRYKVVVCATRWRDEAANDEDSLEALRRMHARGVEFLPLGRRLRFGPGGWRSWSKLYRRLRRGDIDVLHSHKFGSNVWGALIGRLARVPVMVAHEHSWSFEGQLHRRLLDRFLVARNYDVLVAVSREDRRRMIEIERVRPEKVVYIPNGIPSATANPNRDLGRELGIPRGAPLVGTVANLRKEKALETLIEAAVELEVEFPQLQVLLIGDGPERQRLEAIATAALAPQTVSFLGQRSDVVDLLDLLDVAVVTSEREGMPLAVMEYMRSALPVVATRVGGIPHMIEDGEQGLLVEPHNPRALADAIATVLRDPQWAGQLGAAARERWEREFSFDVMLGRIEALYERLLVLSRRVPSAQK